MKIINIFIFAVAMSSWSSPSISQIDIKAMNLVEFNEHVKKLKETRLTSMDAYIKQFIAVLESYSVSPNLLKSEKTHETVIDLYDALFTQELFQKYDSLDETLYQLEGSLRGVSVIHNSVLEVGKDKDLYLSLIKPYSDIFLNAIKELNANRTPNYIIKIREQVGYRGIHLFDEEGADDEMKQRYEKWKSEEKVIQDKWHSKKYNRFYEQCDNKNHREELLDAYVLKFAKLSKQFIDGLDMNGIEKKKNKLLNALRKELKKIPHYDTLPSEDPHEKEKAKDRLLLKMLFDKIS